MNIQQDVFSSVNRYNKYLDALVYARNILTINNLDELPESLKKVAVENAIGIQKIINHKDVQAFKVQNTDLTIAYVHSLFLAEHIIKTYLDGRSCT